MVVRVFLTTRHPITQLVTQITFHQLDHHGEQHIYLIPSNLDHSYRQVYFDIL